LFYWTTWTDGEANELRRLPGRGRARPAVPVDAPGHVAEVAEEPVGGVEAVDVKDDGGEDGGRDVTFSEPFSAIA
jgi:hypothetical protein